MRPAYPAVEGLVFSELAEGERLAELRSGQTRQGAAIGAGTPSLAGLSLWLGRTCMLPRLDGIADGIVVDASRMHVGCIRAQED
jgi:hypothetical protein